MSWLLTFETENILNYHVRTDIEQWECRIPIGDAKIRLTLIESNVCTTGVS